MRLNQDWKKTTTRAIERAAGFSSRRAILASQWQRRQALKELYVHGRIIHQIERQARRSFFLPSCRQAISRRRNRRSDAQNWRVRRFKQAGNIKTRQKA